MRISLILGLAVMVGVPSWATAAPLLYKANLIQLNGSGVSGTADLTLDGNQLTVHIQASGLEANQPHAQHIHGLVDGAGNPINSTSPGPAQDADNDGFVELAEGLPNYGPVLVPLTSPPGGDPAGFPTAPGGTIDFTQIYDITDTGIYAGGFTSAQLLPLDLREVVLHGMTVGAVGAGTPGEVDGTAGYKAVLPVASGEIFQIPEPGTLGLLAAGLLGLGFAARRGRRTAA